MLKAKLLCTLALLTIPCTQALGVVCTSTWTGASSDLWATIGNWSPACVPGGTATDTATFPSTATLTVHLPATTVQLQTLTFSSASDDYVLTSDALSGALIQFAGGSGPSLISVPNEVDPAFTTIDAFINLTAGASLTVTVDSTGEIDFLGGSVSAAVAPYGILDVDSGAPSTLTFNGAGDVFINSAQQPIVCQTYGDITVSNGIVTLDNLLNNATGAGITIGSPTGATTPTFQLTGGFFVTSSDSFLTAGVGNVIGVSLPQASIMNATINGGGWNNTNGQTIGALTDTGTKYGTRIFLNTVTITNGPLLTSNQAPINSGGAAVDLNINTLSIAPAGTYSITNEAPLDNGATASTISRYGMLTSIGTAALSGGTWTVENQGVLTHQSLPTSFPPQGVNLTVTGLNGTVLNSGSLAIDNISGANIIGDASSGLTGTPSLAGIVLDINGIILDGAALSISNEGNVSTPTPVTPSQHPKGVLATLGAVAQSAGSFTMSNAGTITAGAGLNIAMTGMSLAASPFSLSNTGAVSGAAVNGILVDIANAFTFSSGTLTLNNANSVTIAAASPGSTSGISFVLSSIPTFTLGGGSIGIANSGTITDLGVSADVALGAAFAATGNFTMASGTSLTISNTGTVNSVNVADTGATLGAAAFQVNGGSIGITNTGTVTGSNDTAVGLGAVLETVSLTMASGSLICSDTGPQAPFRIGAGIVSISGIALQGGTMVNNGGTFVSISPDPVITVSSGAILAGNKGTFASIPGAFNLIATTVTNNGTFIPGAPTVGGAPGVLNVVGTYTQSSTGTFVANLLNTSAGNFSQLVVTDDGTNGGLVNLSGTLEVALAPGAILSPTDTFTIITATKGVAGTFSNVVNLLPPGFVPVIIYHDDPFVEITFSTAVATTIPSFPGALLGTITTGVNQFNQMTVNSRLGRVGINGICPVPNEDCNTGYWRKHRDEKGKKCNAKKKRPWGGNFAKHNENVVENCQPHDWDVYVGPIERVGGEFHSKKDLIGFDYWSSGVLAGIDYGTTHWGLGFAASYEYIKAELHRRWGNFHVNQFHATIYGKYAVHGLPELAFNGIVGGSYDAYQINRKVKFSAFDIDETARGTPGGSEFDALVGMEYTITVGDHGQIIPQLQSQYTYASVNKFSERRAGMFDLKYHSQYAKSLTLNLGLVGNYTFEWTDFTFTPEATVMWQREFSAKQYNVYVTSAKFVEPTEALTMPASGRNIILAGFDLTATWYDRYSVQGLYNFEWNTLYHDHFLYLGFDYKF